MINLRKVRTILIKWKMYLGRSASYVSLLNLGMVLFLTLSKLKEVGYLKFDLGALFLPVYLFTFIFLIAFGWFDMHKLKKMNDLTPLHPKLEEMNKKIDLLLVKRKR